MGAPRLFADLVPVLPPGVSYLPGYLDLAAQRALLDEIALILAAAPLYHPRMKTGVPLINRMSNCGQWGWHSDEMGYRYIAAHPETGRPWPPLPASLLRLAEQVTISLGLPVFSPDACLINAYGAKGKLNLHQDHDEKDFSHPILSVSLGADGQFLIGGNKRKDPVTKLILQAGDVLLLHGPGRMLFHGVDRIWPGTAPFSHPILPDAGRINLTLRKAM